jgi:hypothetical protein
LQEKDIKLQADNTYNKETNSGSKGKKRLKNAYEAFEREREDLRQTMQERDQLSEIRERECGKTLN